MPQELLLAHCLETFALSLLLQGQVPRTEGFLAPGRPPPWLLYLTLGSPPQDQEPASSFPQVSPADLTYNLAEPVATASQRPI